MKIVERVYATVRFLQTKRYACKKHKTRQGHRIALALLHSHTYVHSSFASGQKLHVCRYALPSVSSYSLVLDPICRNDTWAHCLFLVVFTKASRIIYKSDTFHREITEDIQEWRCTWYQVPGSTGTRTWYPGYQYFILPLALVGEGGAGDNEQSVSSLMLDVWWSPHFLVLL